MRLAGVLSIINMHSWSDYALNMLNSAAHIIGVISAALVLISIALIYFTGTELTGRAKVKVGAPGEDSTKALRRSQAELTAARRSDEAKTARLLKGEAELAAARKSDEAKTKRLAQVEAELAATRQSDEAKASRLAQVEKDLAAARLSTETKAARLTQLEAELAAARKSEASKAARVAELETQLAEAVRSDEAKVVRLTQVEAELAATRRSAEETKVLAKQLEQKQGPRKITLEQRKEFLDAVRGLPTGRVIVSAFFDNKETHDFGAEILSLLKEDGFNIVQRAPLNFFTTSRPSSGVRIGCENISRPPAHFSTVQAGFKAIGLETPTTTIINAQEDDVVEIQITPKQ